MADGGVTARRIAEFVELGEAGVRESIAKKQWGEEKERLALAWLEMQRQEREAKVHAEQLAISRATKDASERSADAAVESAAHSGRSADAAERSANTAKSANVIAGIALIVAVLGVGIALYAALHGK